MRGWGCGVEIRPGCTWYLVTTPRTAHASTIIAAQAPTLIGLDRLAVLPDFEVQMRAGG